MHASPLSSFPARRAIRARLRLAGLLAAGLAACAGAAAQAPDTAPEAQTAYTPKQAAMARRFMAVTAHPLATDAAWRVLDRGGHAIDAAIAAQAMLSLVEPQSSGLGGGAFLLYYDAATGTVSAFDGRETAPAAAGADRFLEDGRPMEFAQAVDSGKSVGVPGMLRALELAHARHGRQPWRTLFDDAIARARHGFPVSQRLAALLDGNARLAAQPAARAYFFHADGTARRQGEILRNPALARTLADIARHGADAFYHGAPAQAMVDAVRAHPQPGDLSLADLAGYAARERPALCRPYRAYTVCGMPPPSSGGLAVAQMLALLDATPLARYAPLSAEAVHYFSEAGRLAYADRDRYVADPDFVDVPVQALLEPAYVARRAALIRPDRAMGRAHPGEPLPGALSRHGEDDTPALPSTTHLSIVDAEGNAVAMTASIEQAFGSKIFVGGFLLNNELTDFALSPRDARGRPAANRVEPGKRPRSTMAPTIVLRRDGAGPALRLVVGAPGGVAIANYVAQTVLANLTWGLDIQSAIDLPRYGSRNGPTELERGTVLESLQPALRAMGHATAVVSSPSGLHGVEMMSNGMLRGGADPRREGMARGR
ncbi:Gamma-glutamyltranspeptidase precursor [Pigmentiphaga humi]|uniref:Glutathione hydrolase proenzyme n=1 Tax=Pigmentiphaga humi TaxID=2478468 RepID=A0A3P4B547_9BURK|nr:gamma-glutamyltransferase [Pigmentiphaga humi]VCU70656.1 Gamma-glutamyltranspeptidase precursor [Pigmentiphaga humi]